MIPVYLRIRYIIDRIVSVIALILLSPILIIVSLLIASDGGPIFFRQQRVGYKGKSFKVFKFRSMIVDADNHLDARGMPTKDRITPVGKFIRKSSIDELPQLLNIVFGEMAIIGPRPILPDFVTYMHPEECRRFDIKPGLAGWSQVNGRNMIKWSKRFQLDNYYLENASVWLDIKILIMTVWMVLSSKDIATDRNATDVDDITIRDKHSV